jgi:hypothetical protein
MERSRPGVKRSVRVDHAAELEMSDDAYLML